MRRREDRAIRKHTLNLYDGDYEKLQVMHGTRIGAAKVIRDLVRLHIKTREAEAAQRLSMRLVDDLEVNIEGLEPQSEGIQ